MNFFADENIEREIVEWLRNQGHDVFWSAQSADGESDETVLERASAEHRVIITSDLDFGEHLFRLGRTAAGLIQMRIQVDTAKERLGTLQQHWPLILPNIVGHVLVVTNTRVRRRKLP